MLSTLQLPARTVTVLKAVAIGLGALVGLVLLSLVLFFAFFPKELAAREAERRIEAATGRDLSLGQDISVTFWPALGFSVDQMALSNPEGFSADEPFLAAERITFAVAVMPLLRGDIEVKQLILERAALNLRAGADGAANWTFPTDETAPEQEATLEDLKLEDVRLIGGAVSFQGADGAPPLQLANVDASLALESLDTPASLEAAFDYRGERLRAETVIGAPRAVLEKGETPFTAAVRAAPLNASFDGAFNAADGALNGQLSARGASLRRLMAWIGSPMGEGGGFGAFRLDARMAHLGDETRLSGAAIALDDIAARGDLTLLAPPGAKLSVSGALSADALDLNPYLPAPTQTGEPGVEVSTAWSDAPIDLSGLNALNANLNLNLGALTFQRMRFSNVALALRIARGAADARLTRVSLYSGGGSARLIADGSGATPRIAFELDADNVQAEPLLTDAIGFDKIAGRGRLRASLMGQGASQAAIMRSLNGTASFNFNDGQYKGVNLAQVARTVQAALSGQAVSGASATDFAELAADFRVSGGVAATENLRLLNPFVRLEGQGLIDIGAQSIDMRIAPRAVRSIEGQGGDVAAAGLGVPFRVHGPWARVSFQPALGDVVRNELRARAQDILRRQDQSNPLTQLGEALFGAGAAPAPAPSAPAEGEAAQPGEAQTSPQTTPPPAQPTPESVLGDLFRRAVKQRTQPPAEEPAPAPEQPAPNP